MATLDPAFKAVRCYLHTLKDDQKGIEYTTLTGILKEKLREENGVEDKSIVFAKKNLCIRIDRNIPGINFLNFIANKYSIIYSILSIN